MFLHSMEGHAAMPRINLRDNDADFKPEQPDPSGPENTPPQLGEYDDGQGRKAPWIVLAVVVVLIGAVVVALNQLHVIQLWGKKAPRVVEALQEPPPAMPEATASGAQAPGGEQAPAITEPTPLPTEPAVREQPSKGTTKGKGKKGSSAAAGSAEGGRIAEQPVPHAEGAAPGGVAVQLSSWPSKGRADRIASSLTTAGFHAYVAQADVNGKTWYRVRIGNYASQSEADAAIAELQRKGFEGAMIVK
jgi:septal ring-binding cell division protein DamX